MSNDNSDDSIDFDIEDIFEEEVVQEIEIEEFELDEILPDSIEDDEDESVSTVTLSSKPLSDESLSSELEQSEPSSSDSVSHEPDSVKSTPSESLPSDSVSKESKSGKSVPSETSSSDSGSDEPESDKSTSSKSSSNGSEADEPESVKSTPSKSSSNDSDADEPDSVKSTPNESLSSDSVSNETRSGKSVPSETSSSDSDSDESKSVKSTPSESSSTDSVSDEPSSLKSTTSKLSSNGSVADESNPRKSRATEPASSRAKDSEPAFSESTSNELKTNKPTPIESEQNQSREEMVVMEPETSNQDSKTVTVESEPFVEVTEISESVAATEETKAEVERRIMSASRELDSLVRDVVQQDSNSLAATELDIMQAKNYLSMHKLRQAKNSVKRAEEALVNLEEDVLYLRRSIAMLHRLLKEKKIDRIEAENILLGLRKATSAAEIGDVGQAATEIEFLVDDLIGGNTSTLNPFFFRHFWLGVDTRWPAGGDTGVLLVRLINDGPIAMPAMRLSPPVPEGWSSIPTTVDLPIIAPGGNLPLRFDIKSEGRYGADEIPLSRKLAVSTGYEMRSGEIMVTIRAQNRSMEPLSDVILSPWLPPGYTTAKVPFVERLSPDEVAIIRMPLTIDMGTGGRS